MKKRALRVAMDMDTPRNPDREYPGYELVVKLGFKRSRGQQVAGGSAGKTEIALVPDGLWRAIFAGLAEFERELIVERTKAGLQAARARGRHGGRPYKMTTAKLRLARAAMGQPETKVGDLCAEFGITRQTLYRFVSPQGELREDGKRLLERRTAART